VHLPSWGADAVIDVHRRDGTHAPMAEAVALADVARVELGGRYEATPLGGPPGAVLLPVATTPQPTAPRPGPTLAIRLVAGAPFAHTGLAVRLRL
jgi:hypothetical protein